MGTTKKQHYIPQVYLRGFSPDYKCNSKDHVNKDKATIYQYSFEKGEVSNNAVPIKTVCYSNHLYEIRDKDGEFIYINWLETVLKQLEIHFSKYRDRLEKKAFCKENYDVKHFLDSGEKNFWFTYMILQIMRLPQVLNAAEIEITKCCDEKVSRTQIHNSARMVCLPLFKEARVGEKDLVVFDSMYKRFLSMECCVGVSRNGGFYTSDKPVYVEIESENVMCFEQAFFPITSYICLCLFDGNYKSTFKNNILFEIDKKQREYNNACVASNAFDKVYSNHRLTQGEIKRLQKCREGI